MTEKPAIASFLDHLSNLTAGISFSRVSIFHDRCSLGCKHCGWRGHPSDVPYISDKHLNPGGTSAWMRTLEWCRQRGVDTVTLTGGEVTEREDYFDIIQQALWLGLRIVVETHGQHFADKRFPPLSSSLRASRSIRCIISRIQTVHTRSNYASERQLCEDP